MSYYGGNLPVGGQIPQTTEKRTVFPAAGYPPGAYPPQAGLTGVATAGHIPTATAGSPAQAYGVPTQMTVAQAAQYAQYAQLSPAGAYSSATPGLPSYPRGTSYITPIPPSVSSAAQTYAPSQMMSAGYAGSPLQAGSPAYPVTLAGPGVNMNALYASGGISALPSVPYAVQGYPSTYGPNPSYPGATQFRPPF